MKFRFLFLTLILCYGLLIVPVTEHMRNRPVEVKLGYLLHPQILKTTSGEHAPTLAGFIMSRVLFYFGTVIQKLQENIIVRPEFFNLYKTLQGIVHLDPYNMDAYYFTQATFTWDLGRVEEANHLLKKGLIARPWDPWLPFYLGFNYSYFLKDYQQAAVYLKRAAELSGNPLFANLAARYFYESAQSAFGLAFLETMIRDAKNPAIRKSYEMRREALLAVITIEQAIDAYKSMYGGGPKRLADLVRLGLLTELPHDPYGGTFYLDTLGKVRTTSNFTKPAKNSQ
jgi:tetratricopeptide (TPR) repeat protein